MIVGCLWVSHLRLFRLVAYTLVHRRAQGSDLSPPRRWATARAMVGLIVNVLAVGVAFISPMAVLVMTGAVSIYYIVDQLTEGPAVPAQVPT